MLAFINGKLHSKEEGSALVETAGLGYEVLVPTNVHAELPAPGESIFLFLSFVVRENQQTLFGFKEREQKSLFEILLGVSGVGPKTALQLVGNLSLDALHEAVRTQNIALMCKVPGIGKKTAQRLLLEIKDKLPSLNLKEPAMEQEGTSGPSQLTRDAMSALINLGYNQAAAQVALQQALKEEPEPPNLPALITKALQFV